MSEKTDFDCITEAFSQCELEPEIEHLTYRPQGNQSKVTIWAGKNEIQFLFDADGKFLVAMVES